MQRVNLSRCPGFHFFRNIRVPLKQESMDIHVPPCSPSEFRFARVSHRSKLLQADPAELQHTLCIDHLRFVCFDSAQMGRHQGYKFTRRDDLSILPKSWKMTRIAGDEIVRANGFCALQEDIVLCVARNV